MNLWIRNQDKNALIPINKMITYSCEGLFYDGIILGTYKTKERALEVLDEIQRILMFEWDYKDKFSMTRVYTMPEE